MINKGRMCDFLEPPGAPKIGLNSYAIKSARRTFPLTWSFTGSVKFLTAKEMQDTIQAAFDLWSTAIPALTHNFVTTGGDIVIGVGQLGSPAGSFILGRTVQNGSTITITLNNAVTFVAKAPGGNSLLSVLAHEIGHAIGILHSTTPGTLMFPFNSNTETLASEDLAAARALYAWEKQQLVPGIGTSTSPALCACGPWLIMAWRGIGDDDRIWLSRSIDGNTWLPQREVPGTGTTDGPALAWDGNILWFAIRGVDGDDALYWATSNDLGDTWSAVTSIPGAGSTVAPTLGISGGVPILVWRGVPGDDALYFSTWKNPWTIPKLIPGTGSADRPSVCIGFDNLAHLVWRGVPGDDSLWTTSLVGQFWQPQQQLSWIVAGNGSSGTVGVENPGSRVGPTITNGGGVLYLAWTGVGSDDDIYFTQAAPGPGGLPSIEWSSQTNVPGIGTSDRPAIVTFNGLPFMAWKGVEGDHGIYTTRQSIL